MNFMASHSYEPTTAAAQMPLLRKCVNVLRGRLFGGSDKGEGGERRIDWNARLDADRQRRLASFELQDWKRRRAAALKGRAIT